MTTITSGTTTTIITIRMVAGTTITTTTIMGMIGRPGTPTTTVEPIRQGIPTQHLIVDGALAGRGDQMKRLTLPVWAALR